MAEKSEVKIILSDFMLDIVLSGLNTLKTLKELKLLLLPPKRWGSQAVITIIKSKIFHPSLRYAFLFNINPNPIILRLISTV